LKPFKSAVSAALLLAALVSSQFSGHAQIEMTGVQDPAWAPDGKRIAVSYFDRIWTMSPEGKQPAPLVGDVAVNSSVTVERDPAWSPDGTRIAFATNRGGAFDV
jgi:uncharacterized protein involved in high-affinity Fe2+ transport